MCHHIPVELRPFARVSFLGDTLEYVQSMRPVIRIKNCADPVQYSQAVTLVSPSSDVQKELLISRFLIASVQHARPQTPALIFLDAE